VDAHADPLEAAERLEAAVVAISDAGASVPSVLLAESDAVLAILADALESPNTLGDLLPGHLADLAGVVIAASEPVQGLAVRDGQVVEEPGQAIPPSLFDFWARLYALTDADPRQVVIDLVTEWLDDITARLEWHLEEAAWTAEQREGDRLARVERARMMRRWERNHPEVLVPAPAGYWRPERRSEHEPFRRLRARQDRAFQRAHCRAGLGPVVRVPSFAGRPRVRERGRLSRRAHAPPEPARPRPGRPPTDPLDLLDRVVDAVVADPELAAHPRALAAVVKGREGDVRRIACALRKLGGIELPAPKLGRPKKVRPNPWSGS
jgi:hypothetical protein